jgi:peptidoglycan hydrolase-like protein with peptidoglycan-binding domain
MIGANNRISVAVALLIGTGAITAALAESRPVWQLHKAIEGDERPFLCKDPEAANLIVAVLQRALEVKADAGKSKRLLEIAAKLESEICFKPTADDIVILRCTLDQKSFGSVPVSLVKLSALLRSDASAGEQAFYAWTYATIEAGSAGASADEANKRWCTEETVADAPVEITPNLVLRVQQRFFDFGFNMPQIDGRLNPETVQAVIDFQSWAGLPPTGQLTRLTVDKIDATDAPTPWVALAFTGAGNHSLAKAATRRGAEADAVKGLGRRARDYRLAAVPAPSCIAFATTQYGSRRRRYTQAFSSAGESQGAASQSVLDYCGREKGGGTCRVRDAACAGTTTKPEPRYDPDNMSVNSRFDPDNISANAAPPPSAGKRFNPKNIPLNSAAPSLSAEPQADGSDDPPPELPQDKPKP